MSVMRIKDAQGNWQEVAALQGLPGTSVSITNITQSTEDDGYSVVTFSDGKTLRVKNGSKGSAGEGGAGGGVLLVNCTPSEDMQSFTADKSFEEILDAMLNGKTVNAMVLGIEVIVPLTMCSDEMVMFSTTVGIETEVMSISLIMSMDGARVFTLTPIKTTSLIAHISEMHNGGYVSDISPGAMYESAQMGIPVFADFLGGQILPAQGLAPDVAVFGVEIPGENGGKLTAVIKNDNTVDVTRAPAGGGGALRVVVEYTDNPGECTSTMTASEIFAAAEAGQQVECIAFLRSLGNLFLRPAIIAPEMVLFGGVYGTSVLGIQNQYCSVIVTNNTHTYSISPLDKLPNPEPLTINGTSYDGSEAVNIDIAAGGGGNKWELIETITISSDVTSINRTKDLNGATYSLAAAMIRADCGATATGGYVRVYFRGTSSYIEIHIDAAVGGTSLSWTAECCQECGMMIGKATTPRNGSRDAASYIPPRYGYDFIPAEPIKKIDLVTNSKFAVGTKIEIWGVRA